MIPVFRQLLARSDASGSRSTIMNPLTWLLSILLTALIVLLQMKAPDLAVISLGIVFLIVVMVYIFAYVYSLLKNPDSLRSERFTIQKLVVEKGGLIGDNSSGLFELESLPTEGSNALLINNSEEDTQ